MRKLIFTVVLFIICFAGIANSQWIPYTNFPTSNNIGGVSIPESNSNYVFVATYNPANPFQTLFVKSSNRGNTWITINSFPGFFAYPSSIGFSTPETGIAVGMNAILATSNGGSLWGPLYVVNDTVKFEKFALKGSSFWAIGHKIEGFNFGAPVVIKNSNFPVGTFTRLTLPSSFSDYQLTGLCIKDANNCIISTLEVPPVIIKTTNGGGSWITIQIGGPEREIRDMITHDQTDEVIAVGGAENIVTISKSDNFGSNWFGIMEENISGGPFRAVGSPFEFLRDRMYAVGNGGCIYATTNAGDNWFPEISYLTANLKWITKSYPDGLFGVTAGDFERNSMNNNRTSVINLTTNGGVWIHNISNEVPDRFLLEQNYPNPFNSMTNIRFKILYSANVKIAIYDIIGRETDILINENLQAGTYEVSWNAENVTSGIYFCRMEAAGNYYERCLVLIK